MNSLPMPDKPRKVGDKIRVNMHAGKIVDATIKAIIESTHGVNIRSILVCPANCAHQRVANRERSMPCAPQN
jgi:hypothetical protein